MASPGQPLLFCFDGSDGSRRALHSVAGLLEPRSAVVLTCWQSLASQLIESGGFGSYALEGESDADEQEGAAAQAAADDGARLAREAGYDATARVQEADGAVWQTIVDVADEIDAGLIVCGTRGRGPVKSALLGSVSREVLTHAGRPVLVSPEPRGDA